MEGVTWRGAGRHLCGLGRWQRPANLFFCFCFYKEKGTRQLSGPIPCGSLCCIILFCL